MQGDLFHLLNKTTGYQGWAVSEKGNRTRIEYYAGVEVGNPSGTTSNMKFVYYEKVNFENDKVALTFRQEFTYDSSDNLLTVNHIG